MAECLLEIFQEEIPARMQAKAVGQLLMRFTHQLDQAKLRYASLRGYVTPLRLVLVIEGLEGRQSDRSTESKGPLLSAPEKAIAGFLRNHGLADIADCDHLETPKGTALLYRQTVHGQTTVELLPTIIATVLRDFSWTNEMRFANQEFRWVRPLRQVLAVYDGVALEGSLDLGGRKQPFAQEFVLDRFRSDVHPAPKNFAEYKKALSASGIVLDAEQRQAQIRQGLEQLARAEGCVWHEDRFLLDEVAGLVEQVHVLHGSIEARFMALPDAVLRLVIRTHQKYFVFNELDGNCL
ncbi:MAG: glycine--tRNA ligase subunit beta, partial [Alphaproteobacteria bacterium]|nr:glycine--tRNA ligase subunit beta [Alphaproteobacteria bacterium]